MSSSFTFETKVIANDAEKLIQEARREGDETAITLAENRQHFSTLINHSEFATYWKAVTKYLTTRDCLSKEEWGDFKTAWLKEAYHEEKTIIGQGASNARIEAGTLYIDDGEDIPF